MDQLCSLLIGGAFAVGWIVRDFRQFMTPVHPLLDELDKVAAELKVKRRMIGNGVEIYHSQVWTTRHGEFELQIREFSHPTPTQEMF